MNQYIIDLVQNNNRVIIPGFGAFIVAREKGLTILFNNFLQFNDGLMANYVAQKEEIEVDLAIERIEQFVSSMQSQLTQTGAYTLPGLGNFSSDSMGAIRFEQQQAETVESTPSASKQPHEDVLLHFDPQPEHSAVDTSEEHRAWNTPSSHQILSDPLIELQPEVPKNNTTKPKAHRHKSKKTKTRKTPVFILIGMVLVIAVVFSVFYFGGKDPNKSKHPAPTSTDSIPAIAEQSIISESQAKPATPAPSQVATRAGFHIVVGSHQTEQSANAMVVKLQQKGYPRAQWLLRGKRYLVSIDSAPTSVEADRIQEEILDRDRIESWIITVY